MLHTLGLLLGCQLLGEIAVRGFGLAMPGPVLGLALLVLLLGALPALAERVRPTTTVILAHLSFLFVPAGVGVIGNFEVLLDDGLTLLVVLTLSTVLSMLATVGTFICVRHLTESRAT
jgi:holin-like protein